MSVINTNITSMIGQSNLQKSQSALQTSMERLSSGLRINSAKDDAAGQAIANRMTAQINGLAQAQRNANDGISIAQTAEGGLNQINDNLQRVRELSVQAANGTNSSNDLQSIQDEINQRLEEIDRISRETDFNGTRVLSEDAETLSIQVGSQDGQVIEVNLSTINSETLKLGNFDIRNASFDTAKLDDATAVNLSTESLLASDPTTVVAAATFEVQDVTFADANPPAADPIQIFADDTDTNVFYAFDGTNYYEGVTLDADTNTFSFTSANLVSGDSTIKPTNASADALAAGDYVDLGNGETVLFENTVIDSGDVSAPDEAELFVDSSGALFASYDSGATVYAATIGLDGEVSFDSSGSAGTATGVVSQVIEGYKIPVGEVTAQTAGIAGDFDAEPEIYALADNPGSYVVKGEQGGETVYFEAVLSDEDGTITLGEQIVQLDTSSIGDDAQVFQLQDGTYVAKGTENGADAFYQVEVSDNGSVTLGDKLNADPLASLDSALNQIDSLRSELGAVQNRFEDAITNLNTNQTNLSAARSRIEDADYAMEVANMTRAQILQQAGTSVLAQANQIPQSVLSLLG